MIDAPRKALGEALACLPAGTPIWVAYSGGLDSTVLLACAVQWAKTHHGEVTAVHINHGLSPHADRWQAQCEQQCRTWQVALVTARVNVVLSGRGLEAAARAARQAAFLRSVPPGAVLLLAHHADDQAETFLLRVLRGAGTRGLGAMRADADWQGRRVMRPFLDIRRSVLEVAARTEGLAWVDDESNADVRLDRNFLRHGILPALQERWPGGVAAMARAAAHQQESSALLDDLAALDAVDRIGPAGQLTLPVDEPLPLRRQRNLIRHWCRTLGIDPPPQGILTRIVEEVVCARQDATPVVTWGALSCRRFRGALYLTGPLPAPPPGPQVLSTPLPSQWPLACGTLGWKPDTSAKRLPTRWLETGGLTLRWRGDAVACQLAGRPGQSLKKHVYAAGIPPWWRDHLPVLFVDDAPAFIPGVGVCEGFAAEGGEPGIWLDWTPPVFRPAGFPGLFIE